MTAEIHEKKRSRKELLSEAFAYFSLALGKEARSCLLYRDPGSSEFSLVNSQLSYTEFTTEPARQAIVHEASRGPRSILILDAQTDSRLKDINKPVGLKSALCVPISGKRGLLGFLYSETNRQNHCFSQGQVEEFDEYAARIAPEWEEILARDSGEAGSETLKQWLAVGVVSFLIVFAFGAFKVSQDIKPPLPSTETIKPAQAEVETVVKSFLTALKVRQFDSAHYFLASSFQERYQPQAFQKVMSRWLDQDQNGWDLKYREVVQVTEKVGRAEVTVRSKADDKRRRDWKWSLVKQPDGWKLFGFQGGPPVKARD
jgi:hypothetical protein